MTIEEAVTKFSGELGIAILGGVVAIILDNYFKHKIIKGINKTAEGTKNAFLRWLNDNRYYEIARCENRTLRLYYTLAFSFFCGAATFYIIKSQPFTVLTVSMVIAIVLFFLYWSKESIDAELVNLEISYYKHSLTIIRPELTDQEFYEIQQQWH